MAERPRMATAGMNLPRILDLIESCSQRRVLFVGDSIIDEYQYISPLGKASKENIIAVRAGRSESFDGGIAAAAAHARSFCGAVDVFSPGPVTRKTRFVEEAYVRKLFEIHYEEEPIFKSTSLHSNGYDAIVVADFGHGAVTPPMIKQLCLQDRFLAVCAQTNSANAGYNLITKYPRADYVVIDEPEARLAAADRDSPIEEVIKKLAVGRFGRMIVTHGRAGATGWDSETGFHHCPAFADKVIDTMGAGDAFFAVTAPMAINGSLEDLLTIGNAAGAIKTQIVGHRAHVTKDGLIKFLEGI